MAVLGDPRPDEPPEPRRRKRHWYWQYLITLVALAAVAAAIMIPLRSFQERRRDMPPRAPTQVTPSREVEWVALPARAVRECRRANRRADFPILCPREVPIRTTPCLIDRALIPAGREQCPAEARARILLDGPDVQGVELAYSGHSEDPAQNVPSRFLHFAVLDRSLGFGREDDFDRTLGRRRMGGRRGRLYLVREESYHLDHLLFIWNERGMRYVATLHEWDDRQQAIGVLRRLVRGLRPVRALG